jgi:hypothetical protein
MGFPDLQRELVRARNTYLGAVRRTLARGRCGVRGGSGTSTPVRGRRLYALDRRSGRCHVCLCGGLDTLIAARRGYNAAAEDLLANDTPSPKQ